MESNRMLKSPSPTIVPFPGRSDTLIRSHVQSGLNPRGRYLTDPSSIPAPIISSSPFIPSPLISHLMRRKKNGALGVKFTAHSGTDEITNMEGALHTFVTPICLSFLHGDYRYRDRHGMVRFPDVRAGSGDGSMQQAREVIVSASVQPDFEGADVMLAVCAIGDSIFEGRTLPVDFEILKVGDKQDKQKREAYDTRLRSHMIYHLTAAHRLPSLSKIATNIVEGNSAIALLEEQIRASKSDYTRICDTYVRLPSHRIISLEVLFNSAIQQLRNEISALETLCPQGYVLTIDPPSIFAQKIGATLLNRIQFTALRWLAEGASTFTNMKALAFNDYADLEALRYLKAALEKQGHVQVVAKIQLFTTPESLYRALPGMEGTLLVIHNNSDGFGQNIESEWESGSMDGAIGVNSSASASLFRTRDDLVDNLM